MRKILLVMAALALAAAASPTSPATHSQPVPKQFVINALVLCSSQVLMQENQAVAFKFQKCAILPRDPGSSMVHTVQPASLS